MQRGANLRIERTDLLRASSMAGGCFMLYATYTRSASLWFDMINAAIGNMIGMPIPYSIAKKVMFSASEYLK